MDLLLQREADNDVFVILSALMPLIAEPPGFETPLPVWNSLIKIGDSNSPSLFELPKTELNPARGFGFCYAKDSLFMVGGRGSSLRGKFWAIRYLNLQQKDPPASWKTIDTAQHLICYTGGRTFSFEDRIAGFGLGPRMFSFNHRGVAIDDMIPNISTLTPPDLNNIHPELLGVTAGKMYIFWGSDLGSGTGELGYYDLDPSGWPWNMEIQPSWHTVDRSINWPALQRTAAVLVKGRYVILFSLRHPLSEPHDPALYIYDISTGNWLVQPVQGISALPQSNPGFLSLMEVGADRLALVWFVGLDLKLHWVKFTLCINNETDPPTFLAECVSSSSFSVDDREILDFNITTVPLSLEAALDFNRTTAPRSLEVPHQKKRSREVAPTPNPGPWG